MHRTGISTALICAVLFLLGLAIAEGDEIRVVERDGVTYREVVRNVRKPVAEVRVERRTHEVYRDEFVTEMRDTSAYVYAPTTAYQWETRWHDVWNPFRTPYATYHLVPRIQWNVKTETVSRPVTYRRLVPETRVVEVPTRTLRFETEQQVVSRVAVSTPPGPVTNSETAVARRIGGTQLESDPPRRR